MSPRRVRPALVLTLAGLAVAVVALVVVRPGPAAGLIRTITGQRSSPAGPAALTEVGEGETGTRAGEYFLDHYEQPDGRVVRRDQGGDTVSEGQAYAMLVALATGDRRRFGLAWAWARTDLLQPDGLMAWRYAGGRVVDTESASDADMLTAWALDLAAARFQLPRYRQAARRLSTAVLTHEVETVSGRPVMLAGPWARGAAPLTNPSYLAPQEVAALAALDGRWSRIASSSADFLSELLQHGHLPSDWAVVTRDGVAHPTTPPDQPGAPVSYGYDAVRLPVLLASSCDRRQVALTAALWPGLDRELAAGGPLVGLDLGGGPSRGAAVDPVAEVGTAAVAAAAGRAAVARRLLSLAQYTNAVAPTYFGSAWVALGRLLLQGSSLVSCG
jgi:endoglucanase